MTSKPILDRCLADLEARIDLDQEARIREAWFDFLEDRCEAPYFQPPARTPASPAVEWPDVHVNDAMGDDDVMLLQQFRIVSDVLAAGSGQALGVRCNHSTAIIPSLFGCELFAMPREAGTLPAAKPLGSKDDLRAAVGAGVPDLQAGLGERVFRCAQRFLEVFETYPAIGEAVELYHPDTQGPIDVTELLWGSEMFLAVYDEPTLLADVLDLTTDTIIAFLDKWFTRVPPKHDPYSVHWRFFQKGRVMLRNDSLMNLSPDTYVEHVRPRDERVFDALGGGVVHYCGRGEHFIEAMSHCAGLTGVNLGQPELNDMDSIIQNTVDKRLMLLELGGEVAGRIRQTGRDLHGRAYVA